MGEIKKKWRGWCAESFTDTDTFKIEFPDNIDVATKALLMGATMLVVSTYFNISRNGSGTRFNFDFNQLILWNA